MASIFFLRLVSFYLEFKKGYLFIFQFVAIVFETEKVTLRINFFISTQVKQDYFSLDMDQLIFLKADGNYIELTKSNYSQITTEVKKIL